MKRLGFETHIGHFHSLALVKTQYPLLRFMEIFDIGCHLICAMDEVLNLHFIQFRKKEKSDPDIFVPSGAITGHSKILFSFEIMAIYEQVFGKSTSEADFLEFFTTLDHMYRNKPEVCSVRPGVFLFKPTKGGNVYLFDLTVRDNKPALIPELLGVELLSAVDQDVIVFTSTVLQGIFLYHFGNFKMKKLAFSQKSAQVIQVVKQRRLCISISSNTMEILDLRANKILEKSVYESSSVNMLAVSPSGNRLIHSYYHGKVTEGVMRMEIWDLSELKVIRGETYVLDGSQTVDHSLAFLNEEIFVHVRMWSLSVFRIEEHGLCKLQTLSVPNKYGYVHSGKDGHCVWSQISLLTNELNSFLLLTSDVFEDRYNRIEHYKVVEENKEDLELLNENLMPQMWGEGKASKDSVQIRSTLKAQAKLLYLEKADFIQFICVWQDDKVGILYESFRFYEFDLLSGDLTKVMGISGLQNNEESLKKIKYIDKNVLGLFYEKDDSQKQRLILIDLRSRKTIFDTKDLKRNDYLIKVSCIEVMANGWVVLVYRKNDSNQEILGLLDFEKGEVDDLLKFDHGRAVNEIWSLGSQYLAGRLKRHGDTLIIIDLIEKKILKEKRLKSIEQISKNTNEVDGGETYFWAVTKLTDQIISYAISKPEEGDAGVIIYNWIEETVNGLCRVNVEDIYGVLNNELFICLEEAFPQDYETFFATIPIGKTMELKDSQDDLPSELEFEYFGKFFFGFEKSLFGILKNKKQAIIVMKQFFPHYICIMRKRNKKVEILKYIKKQIGTLYHPYLIQDIVKMITSP